jgi:hypothetical protein
MSSKRIKLSVGDVFRIPVDADRVGHGQIVYRWGKGGTHFYFAVFDGTYAANSEPDLDTIVRRPIALLALSLDALLWHGYWQVVGHKEVDPAAIPWPAYKEGVSPPGTYELVDYTGDRRRRATRDEAEHVPFRSIVAPIRVHKAFHALNGVGKWDDVYDALRPPPSDEMTSAALFRGSEPGST